MNFIKVAFFALIGIVLFSCSSDDDPKRQSHMLNITFIMDANAGRLDNFGDPITIPSGNSAQHPDFDILGLHFIGLYPDKFTPYESGVTILSTSTTQQGGIAAIDFENERMFTEANNSLSIPLDDITAGTYKYIRSSIGFQKYDIVYNLGGASATRPDWPSGLDDDIDVKGTVASFLGYNTYIKNYNLLNKTIEVNANKQQGYFGLESNGEIVGQTFNTITEGRAPQTTVVNPISDTSPVPAGSCVVTGEFLSALTIPESPVDDIHVQIIISINNSFEWRDNNGNNKYEPLLGEEVVDMGTRGVFPSVL